MPDRRFTLPERRSVVACRVQGWQCIYMPNTVTLEHAKAHLEDLMAGAERHEEWLVVGKDGRPMGTLSVQPVKADAPAPNTDHRSLFGLMRGQIKMAPDFDEPLEDFKDYM